MLGSPLGGFTNPSERDIVGGASEPHSTIDIKMKIMSNCTMLLP